MNLEQKVHNLVIEESQRVLDDFDSVQDRVDEVVKILRQFNQEVDPKLIQILLVGKDVSTPPKPTPVKFEPVVVAPVEPTKPTPPPTAAKTDPRKTKAEQRRRDLAENLLASLRAIGPQTRVQLAEKSTFSEYAVQKALQLLKQEGKVFTRTDGFQGTTLWFTKEYALSNKQLREYVKKHPHGEVVVKDIIEAYHLNSEFTSGIVDLLKPLVTDGTLIKRAGLYFKEKPLKGNSQYRQGNGKDKKSTYGGAGVATSQDKISSNRDVRDIVAKAKSQGAKVSERGSGHIQVETDKGIVTIGRTPNSNGLRDDKRLLKNIGLNV